MANTVETLVVKVVTDTADAIKNTEGLDDKTKGLIKNFVKFGAVAAGAVVVLKALAKQALAAEKVFFKQEEATVKLAGALKAVNQEAKLGDLQDFADDMQKLTNTGDDVTEGLVQVAISMGATAKEAQNAAKDAIALSVAFGGSMTENIRKATRAEMGQTEALYELLPSLKDITDETERAAAAEELLGDAFEVATDLAESNSGAAEALANATGDLQEAIGQSVSKALTPFRRKLTEIVEGLTEGITEMQNFKVAMEAIEDGTATTAQQIAIAETELVTLQRALSSYVSISGESNDILETNIRLKEAEIEGLKLTEYWTRRMNAEEEERLRLAKEAEDSGWKPEQTWAEAAESADEYRYSLGLMSAEEEIEFRRQRDLAQAVTEYADLNIELAKAINERADAELAAIASVEEAEEATVSAVDGIMKALAQPTLDPEMYYGGTVLNFADYVDGQLTEVEKIMRDVLAPILSPKDYLPIDFSAAVDGFGEVDDAIEETEDNIISFSDAFKTSLETAASYAQDLAAVIGPLTSLIGNLGQIQDNVTQQQINNLEEQKEASLERAEAEGRSQEYMEEYAENYDKTIADLQKKQQDRNKKIAIANAVLNTAVGVAKALGSTFWPLNLIAAGLTLAAGIAQIAVIKNQPSYATGTPSGGYIVPPGYEDDSFPVRAKSGERVTVGDDEGMMTQIIVMLGDKALADTTTRLIRNKKIVIKTKDIAA